MPIWQICTLAAVAGAALGGPAADARACAAAAGSVFEAAPFMIAAELLRGGDRWKRYLAPALAFAGCGCATRRVPGALALPAIALAALAFGPAVAVGRTMAAVAIWWVRRRQAVPAANRHDAPGMEPPDIFAQLALVGTSAFVASLAVAALAATGTKLPSAGLIIAGALVGAVVPCAAAGVAIAAAFSHSAPAASVGALCTAGLLSLPLATAQRRTPRTTQRPVPLSGLLLATALGGLAYNGPSGLVSPRLLVPIALASICAIWRLRTWRAAGRASILVPAAMLAMLLLHVPPPVYRADPAGLRDTFPGERLAFAGAVRHGRNVTMLVRYAITCCRIDATPVAVTLDRTLAIADGGWIAASGTVVRGEDGRPLLHVEAVRAIAPPADPFFYL
jgi:hypothetical protein